MRPRRAQLGGLLALCALATGSTGALLIVANAGADLVRITPGNPAPPMPPRADGLPAGQAGSVTPTREPVFGWSDRETRRPYVHSPSPGSSRSGAGPSPSRRAFVGPSPSRLSPVGPPPATVPPEKWEDEPEFETPTSGESSAVATQTESASPGEGPDRSDAAVPDSAGPAESPGPGGSPSGSATSAEPTSSGVPTP